MLTLLLNMFMEQIGLSHWQKWKLLCIYYHMYMVFVELSQKLSIFACIINAFIIEALRMIFFLQDIKLFNSKLKN